MDIESVVAQLRQEASRIEHAIAALMALVGLGSQPHVVAVHPRRAGLNQRVARNVVA